jgi:hypothetical protein
MRKKIKERIAKGNHVIMGLCGSKNNNKSQGLSGIFFIFDTF